MNKFRFLNRVAVLGSATVILAGCINAYRGSAQESGRDVIAAGPVSPITHVGRWLVDAQGRVVIVHGFNVVNKHPSFDPTGAGFGASDMDFLAREGFNVVRLGIEHNALAPQPGVYDDAYLASIKSTQQQLAERRVFSLIDMHQDGYSRRYISESRQRELASGKRGGAEINNGFAPWMALDNGLPNENPGHPFYYVTSQAINRAFDNLYSDASGPGNTGLIDYFADAWGRLAGEFSGKPYVLGYELLNEPWPGKYWSTCTNPDGCADFDTHVLTPFHRAILGAIRKMDASSLVFYEPNVFFNAGVPTYHEKMDSESGFSFHNYASTTAAAFAKFA